MTQMKKLFIPVALLVIVFLVGFVPEALSQTAGKPQTIRVAMSARPTTLDPVNHRQRISQTMHRMFSDALTWAKPSGQHVPDLAESITQIDPVTYVIKIRKGVFFHNGDPMTADDLIFSIKRLAMDKGMEGKTSPRRPLAGPVKSAEKMDDYTVKVVLERPNKLLQIRNWYHYDIWPHKYFEKVGVEGFIKQPIGVGPFKWVQGDFTSQVVLERNENYYGGCPEIPGKGSRVPMLDRVIVNFIEEPTTRVAALLAGDVDIIQSVPYDSIKLLESNPNTEVLSGMGTNIIALSFNIKKAPFDNKLVRQAIAYAIDYELITKKLLLGHSDPLYGRPLDEPFEGEPGYGQFNDIKGFQFNLERARALMKEAGVGRFSTVIDTWGEYVPEAQVVAQMLGDIGIDASVRVWDYGVLLRESRAGTRSVLYMRHGNGRKSPQWIRDFMVVGQPHNHYTGFYSNPTFDELMKKAIPMDDGPERNNLFREIYKIAMEDVPIIPVHVPRNIEGIRKNVKNYHVCTQGRINLHKVYLDK